MTPRRPGYEPADVDRGETMDESGEQRSVTEREREHQQPGEGTVKGDEHGDPDEEARSWDEEDEEGEGAESDSL
jgi:hypothetical protein